VAVVVMTTTLHAVTAGTRTAGTTTVATATTGAMTGTAAMTMIVVMTVGVRGTAKEGTRTSRNGTWTGTENGIGSMLGARCGTKRM
jgi:hypothetical protein